MLSDTTNTKKNVQYAEICKLADVCMLSAFIRNFPLNNLSDEERRRVTEFEKYVVELEDRLLAKMGVLRWDAIRSRTV